MNVREEKGFGYKDKTSGLLCMIRCFKCGKENHAMMVSSGYCAWCGYNPNKKENAEE